MKYGYNTFTGISLVAAVWRMVALFALCCITFLPSYLGTIFNQRSRIVFDTRLFFGLGSNTYSRCFDSVYHFIFRPVSYNGLFDRCLIMFIIEC